MSDHSSRSDPGSDPDPGAAELGFAPAGDVPVEYMRRTREYYRALGYANPYRWAHFGDVPFTALEQPLGDARLGLVTTAAPFQPEAGDQGPGAPYNAQAKFYRVYTERSDASPDLRISHLGYDRTHTTAADVGTYFPLARLREAAAAGRVGAVAPRFYGVPTNRSQRVTLEQDGPDVLARAREDGVDAALLVAN